MTDGTAAPPAGRAALLYHFGRVQYPAVAVTPAAFDRHLRRMFAVAHAKNGGASWPGFLEGWRPADAFLVMGCLEGLTPAWEALFAARTGRSDQLLVDALRARAVRLFPRDEGRQQEAVSDFWGHLLVAETPGAVPILARYDGLRPLVPWLIRVFVNRQISLLRHRRPDALGEDDLVADPHPEGAPDPRWHAAFCEAARHWLATLTEQEALLLGLRLRYGLSQREVAKLLGQHEGTISRQVDKLRERCLDAVGAELTAQGWTGEDLEGFVLTEMAALLLDEPRLTANRLAGLLAARGKEVPAPTS